MPQKVIKFTGINRKVNEFQGAGACEELINLRPNMNGGCNIVKPKKRHIHNISFDYIYRHSFGNTNNDIAVSNGVVYRLINLGAPVSVTSEFQGKGGIEISSAGNVLLIYCAEMNKQLAYKYEDGKYEPFTFSSSPIRIEQDFYYSKEHPSTNTADSNGKSEGSIEEALNNAFSGFHNKYLNGLCGVSVIGCTYELEDGSEIWSTAFTVLDSDLVTGSPQPELVNNGDNYTVTVHGIANANVVITLDADCDKSVKKINLYSTKSVSTFYVKEVKSVAGGSSQTIVTTYEIAENTLDEVDLFGQPMYFQCSIAPKQGAVRKTLKFGTGLSAEKLMNVDAGCIERTGRNISLNNRFHYFDSKAMHVTQPLSITRWYDLRNANTTTCVAYIRINKKWWLLDGTYLINKNNENHIVYPMSNVEEVVFVEATTSGDVTTTNYDSVWSVKMKNSTAYNYSYASNAFATFESGDEFYSSIKDTCTLWGNGYDSLIPLNDESNVISVSQPYNPFAFDVKYSYGVGGRILDIVTSYIPISSTQISQYPLTIFTSNGIFALEQGDGGMLYGNVIPLNPSVIQGGAVATPHGTFFVSSRNLYLLAGRESINMSYSQNGKIEDNIRENNAYKALCCTESYGFHDFSSSLSNERFEDFITGSVLVYDQMNNEIIVSSTNPDIKYSYVFNLDTKTYFKINKRYLKAQNGGRFVMVASGDINNITENDITDLHSEIDSVQPILLQSRPMQLEALFTHIQRMILYVDAKLEGEQNLCFSVFGSDNLYDWKCIISAQKQNTVLRHIRTNKAAKSYRDYIILISGTVSTDTDLSDIIADYTVVSRRLG